MSKKELSSSECYGLSKEDIKEANKHIRKNKASDILNKQEALPLYEMFILGYSFEQIHSNFKHIPLGKIVATAASSGWVKDREALTNSVYERVKTRMVKSTVEQVEYLTDLISVSTKENSEKIKKYLEDPANNPPPNVKIESLKDYKQVVDMLASIASSMKSSSQNKPENIQATKRISAKKQKADEPDEGATILAELAEE